MADLAAHSTYNASYSGLLSSLWIALGVGGVCMVVHEVAWRLPRRTRVGQVMVGGGGDAGRVESTMIGRDPPPAGLVHGHGGGTSAAADAGWTDEKKGAAAGGDRATTMVDDDDVDEGGAAAAAGWQQQQVAGVHVPLGDEILMGAHPPLPPHEQERETPPPPSPMPLEAAARTAIHPSEQQPAAAAARIQEAVVAGAVVDDADTGARDPEGKGGKKPAQQAASRAGSTTSFASASAAGAGSIYRTPLGTPSTTGGGGQEEDEEQERLAAGGAGTMGRATVTTSSTTTTTTTMQDVVVVDEKMGGVEAATLRSGVDEKSERSPAHDYPPTQLGPSSQASSAGATWTERSGEAVWQRDVPLTAKRALVDSTLGSRERWVFAYLYQNRCWNLTRPMHPLPRFPLGWLATSLFRTSDAMMAPVVGLDATAHTRFLRGTLWWIVLHMCTTLVILLPLHIRYSTLDLKSTSMLRAGLSVKDGSGASRWLWVHVVILYWVLLTWVANLVWVIWGILGLRRRQARHRIEELARDPAKRRLLDRPGFDRYRAVMVTNIPPAMRDEQTLREYFTTHLRGYSLGWRAGLPVFLRRHMRATRGDDEKQGSVGRRHRGIRLRRIHDDGSREDVLPMESSDESSRRASEDAPLADFIDSITLVRRSAEIDALRKDHVKVIGQLEKAHVGLAERVIKAIQPRGKASQPLRDALRGVGEGNAPLWHALLRVDRSLLDPYQAVHKGVPLIDYLAAKEQVLADRLADALAEPFDSLKPASSAFVVFREARFAKRVLRELRSHPLHTLGCQTRPAPEYADIIWPRLSRTVFRADVVKNTIVGVLVFALLVFWIFPTSAIVAIASITNLSNIFPGLANFLLRNDTASSLLDSVVPVVLVAALSLAVCPILLAIGNNLLTLPTGYDVHNFVLFRFWVFEIINTLIFFVVGKTAVQSYVYVTQINATSVLENVASAFPDAAPYYVSYLLLQTVIQSFFELLRLGLPLLFWLFSTRKARLPRIRAFRLAHSTVSWFFQVPNHCFAITITFVFMIYNPLVIPFAFVFFLFAYALYKHQYLWTYGRRYENDGRRNCVRYVRLTLDGMTRESPLAQQQRGANEARLAVMEFTFLAFYILVKNKALGVLSALAMLFSILLKLGLTRIIKAQFDAIAWAEAAQMDALRLGVQVPVEEDALPDNKFTRPFYRAAFWLLKPVERWMTWNEESGEWLVKTPNATGTKESLGDIARHTYSPLWEDLPTPDRALAYSHQPVYHDQVQRYLWLPGDVRGNVDLDDTIEREPTPAATR